MSNFDIGICIDQTTLSGVIAALYARPSLKSQLFSGRQTIAIMGVNLTVGWDVQQAPTVSLNPPSAQQWQNAVKSDGSVPQPVENAFLVQFSQVRVEKQPDSGGAMATTTSFAAICTVSLTNNALTITPMAVVIDLSQASEFDQVMYRMLIIPRVLNLVGTVLSGQQLPDIDFQGTRFGAAVLTVGNGQLTVVANLAGQPAPAAPAPDRLPGGPFSILLSPQAMQQIANRGTRDLQGKTTGTSGSQSFGIGTANYRANVRLDHVSATVSPGDPTTVNAAVGVAVSASAGVDILGVVGDAVEQGAEAVGGGVVTAAKATAGALEDAGRAIKNAFSSY